MKHTFLITIVLSILSLNNRSAAQVTITVPNPSFERTAAPLPATPISWTSALYSVWQWYKCSGSADMMAGDGQWGVNKAPQDGDYFGHMIMPSWAEGNIESIGADLSTPFVPGQAYEFSIQLANMKKSTSVCPDNGNSYVNAYWEIELELYGTNSCGLDELLWESGHITNCDWQQYTGIITPTAAYTQIRWKPKWVDVYALGLPATWNRMYAVGVDNMSDFVPQTPLPVELGSFNAECTNETVLLEWTTLSEINNDYFEIQYSSDGTNFVSVGDVSGAGNSNSLNNYSFLLDDPNKTKGYYRLKQHDFDGQYQYSKLVYAQCNSNSLFVHYSNGNIHVSSSSDIQGIQIFDLLGKLIYSGKEKVVSVAQFQSSMYIVHVQRNNKWKTFKVMK